MVGIMKFSFCHGNLRGTDPWHPHPWHPHQERRPYYCMINHHCPLTRSGLLLKVLLLRYLFVGFISKAADFWHWENRIYSAPLDSTNCSAALPPGIVFRKVTKWRFLSFWNPQKKRRRRSQLTLSKLTYLRMLKINIWGTYTCHIIYLYKIYSLGKLVVLIVHFEERDFFPPKPTH